MANPLGDDFLVRTIKQIVWMGVYLDNQMEGVLKSIANTVHLIKEIILTLFLFLSSYTSKPKAAPPLYRA